MIERIRSLIVDVYIGRIRSAKARLSLLQAQINPHFLYNTLDTINWEAKRAKARTISYMIEQLSDFLRLSLNNGSEKTTVKQEIQHVQAYFNIQKKRMEDNVRLEIFAPGNLNRAECLNLILQPIVENAVVHGLAQKEDGTGSITISGNIEDDIVRLWIDDNGVGFPPNKIDDLITSFNDVENADSADSFGLMNVHSRIRMAYGEPYGLSLCNQKTGGARVTLTFPASTNSLSKQT
jgi:two-component system sensor histidine kinase YesM